MARKYNYRKYSSRGKKSAKELHPFKWKNLQEKCFKRDGYRCQFRYPNGRRCTHKKGLQMHHIIKKSVCPSGTFLLSNVITLCAFHHIKISGKEEIYAPMFKNIIDSMEKNNE